MFRPLTALALSTIALAILPAAASADATCSLAFDVEIEGGGVLQQGPGQARCVGTIDGFMIDPDVGTAFLRATADQGTCGMSLRTGSLRLQLRRIAFFDDPRLDLSGDWSAVVPAVSGLLSTGRVDMDIAGSARMIPRDLSCTSGRLEMELRTSGERATPAAAPAPQAVPPAEKRAVAKKSRKAKKVCRKAKRPGKRASKRCRSARRA